MLLAPIALFVYNRPDHTKRMVESLLKNPELMNSQITVYCDGPRNEKERKEVGETRQIIRQLLPNAKIVENEINQGLAASIIKGVTEQCDKYGRVIVIEDDLILSPVVLAYFNKALEFYESYEKVMHIAAYMYPVGNQLPSVFLYREASCWGWATWKRAWKYFEPNAKVIADKIFQKRLVKEFNVKQTYLFWEMLHLQSQGKVDSWAIRWYGSVFVNEGLALHPGKSLIQNTGFDGSGVHCSITDIYDVELAEEIPALTMETSESDIALNKVIEYRSKNKMHLMHIRLHHIYSIISYMLKKYYSSN